jgi:transcriptional regulator with XRE-family HTH domain
VSPSQCRAARALLEITQPDLAERAGLGLSTIVDFERSRRAVPSETVQVIRHTIEKLGVEFIDENGGGAGVRLRKPSGLVPGKIR